MSRAYRYFCWYRSQRFCSYFVTQGRKRQRHRFPSLTQIQTYYIVFTSLAFGIVIPKIIRKEWVKNFRVDSSLKKEAENLFNDPGLNMSTAITMFLKSAVSHDGIPFEVKRPTPNAETLAALSEYKAMKENPDLYKRYDFSKDAVDEVL